MSDDLPVITLDDFLAELAGTTWPEDRAVSAGSLKMIIRDYRDHAKRLIAARRATPSDPAAEGGVVVPEGWKMVPLYPDDAQMQAGLYQASHDAEYGDVCQSYIDMVAAAPTPAAPRHADLSAEGEVVVPPCWWIDHGSYGQITMRPEEATFAEQEGKRVVAYEQAAPRAGNEAMRVACQMMDDAIKAGHDNVNDLVMDLLAAAETARAALKDTAP